METYHAETPNADVMGNGWAGTDPVEKEEREKREGARNMMYG